MTAPTISDVLDRCQVGPNHYEWPMAGSGQRIDQVRLVRALRNAYEPGNRDWPSKAMQQVPQGLQLADHGPMRPGDIWFCPRAGRLYVTGEAHSSDPSYLKCYWSIGGNPNAPWTCLDPQKTSGFKLIHRTFHN